MLFSRTRKLRVQETLTAVAIVGESC